MSTLESFFSSIGLLWERLHLISAGTVQTAGIACTWTQDLVPVGDRMTAAGELVELRATLDPSHPIADASRIRFDILEFDWLFSGGFDDPVASLKPAAAPDPVGAFTVLAREVTVAATTSALPTLRAVVDDYRVTHAADYETRILVVTDPGSGVTEVVAWWRAVHVPDSGADTPTLYFVAEIPGQRSSSTVPLKVALSLPGVSVRLTGNVHDVEPAALAQAQAVPDAVLRLANRTARTTAAGDFVLDVRLPLGPSSLTVARPGITTRTLAVRVVERTDHGIDVAVLDVDAANAPLVAGALAAGADDQAKVSLDLPLRSRVHRVAGQVQWPATWDPANPTPLAGRIVYGVPLASGAALPQRPKTSREWEALRSVPGVLRSARPARPVQREATGADGRFELSFLDLTEGAQYLLWVEGPDPRTAGTRVNDVIVRTAEALAMRRMAFAGGSLAPETADRRVVDSTYNLLQDDVAGATEVLRIVNTAAAGAAADLRLQRPGTANPQAFNVDPALDPAPLDVVDATKRVTGLDLEVLPLVPVFEPADQQGDRARWASNRLHEQLDQRYNRGHLAPDLRWVLDARRGPTAAWSDDVACAALERTLLTHWRLTSARIHDPFWPWWRADAVSAADFARITEPAGADFSQRSLADDLVPVLVPATPRLLGLFDHRHLHVSPGHGVYQAPSTARTFGSNRMVWAGYTATTENWGGEDENSTGIAMHLRLVADANGLRTTISRESVDPTRLGWVQGPVGTFVEVDPVAHPDYPRLWQQNAAYWIAARWNPVSVPPIALAPIVNAHGGNMDDAGITSRMSLFTAQARDPANPVDAFVAIHTNSAAAGTRGLLTIYTDIRPTAASPAPGQNHYVETNTVAQTFAGLLQTEIADAAPVSGSVSRSYFAAQTKFPVRELFATVTHLHDGNASLSIRATAQAPAPPPPAPAPPVLPAVVFPRPAGRDIPIGYTEVGFHDNPQDAANLSQGWYRFAVGIGMARAAEGILRQRPDQITGADLVALLTRTFGSIPAVVALQPGTLTTVAAMQGAVDDVTGHTPALGAGRLGEVVTALETERGTVTRTTLVSALADAVATVAGWTAAQALAHADDRAEAAYGPVLRALGAPASAAVPELATLPRADLAATRADAAAALGALLGLRPSTLATVTAAVHGETVLRAAVPEQPEAFVASQTLTEAVASLARLRPVDVLHLGAVRVVDAHGAARPTPYRIVPGDTVVLVVDLLGTAWRGTRADVSLVVARDGATVATLTCTARSAVTLTSSLWTVPAAGTLGPHLYDVTARIIHPTAGAQSVGPAHVTIEVAR